MKESNEQPDFSEQVPVSSDFNIDIGEPKATTMYESNEGQLIVDNMEDVTRRITSKLNEINSLKTKIGSEERIDQLNGEIDELQIDRDNFQEELEAFNAKSGK